MHPPTTDPPSPPKLTLEWLGKGGMRAEDAARFLAGTGVLRPGDTVGGIEQGLTDPPPATVLPAASTAPIVDQHIKCWRCSKTLCDYAARPWRFTCPRCKARNQSEPPDDHRGAGNAESSRIAHLATNR